MVQNKMVRFMLDFDARTHTGQVRLGELEMLNIAGRGKQLRLNNAFKII